jgi:flagellar biosynthesis/type III secretory pathway protein FliH
MTSFSDTLWRPFAAFVPTLMPGAVAFAPAPAPVESAKHAGTAEWLPPLRSPRQLDSEVVEREENAYRRGADDAARGERERADARCASALQAIAAAASHLEGIAAEFARDRERDVQAIAIATARHIVQHELTIDTLRVTELVRRALELLPPAHAIEVRLHPADLETLEAGLATLASEGRHVALTWMPDETIERGGFVIETPHRIIDGRTDVGLRALYERIDHD